MAFCRRPSKRFEPYADLHSGEHSDGEASDFLLLADCAWTLAHVFAGSALRECPDPVPVATIVSHL
jgi:hypothetical protein